MKRSPHRLWLASAGTGKTFQLTGHFLGLLLRGVPPERILATTFTRKAAGEILERVLRRLAEGACGGEALASLRRDLKLRELGAADCLALLARLTRRLDRFHVRTIDAFFVHLGRLFALDLDLPAEWRIVDESEDTALRSEAMGRVLARGTEEERLELLRELQKGDAARGVHEGMLAVIRANRDVFLESTDEAWSVIRPAAGPTDDELARALAAWPSVSLPESGSGKPNGHWVRAHEQVLQASEAGDWEAIVSKGLGAKLLDPEAQEYYGKAFPEDLAEVLAVLVRYAGARVLAALAAQTAAMKALLTEFEAAYGELKREQAAYRFEDLPNAFSPRGAPSSVIDARGLDLWFRLDGRIDHLLLDEFQDTSPTQWRVLEHLAEEILAEGTGERSLFCVGDVKQSIYGWRQAEPRLLAGLPERYPVLEPQSMTKSYRSSRVVVDTVNRLFRDVADNPVFAGAGHEAHRRAARRFQVGFEEHETARDSLPGAARVVEMEAGNVPDDAGPMVERTVERVRLLRAEAPAASIGVLLRKGKFIPLLIHELRRAGIAASGEGGNPLTDSESVLVFASLLELADHPDHSAAAFHVATSPFGARVGLTPETGRDRRREVSARLRARMGREGLGDFAASFLSLVEASGTSEWDRSRFAQLVDLAYGFEAHGGRARSGLRATDFVRHLREEQVAVPTSSGVRVMTIHASKGLEFDAVILCDLFERVRDDSSGVWNLRRDPYGPIEEVFASASRSTARLDDRLLELVEHTTERNVTEALCVLYVAVTRARRCLELLVRPSHSSKSGTLSMSFQNLVRAALGCLNLGPAGDDGIVWRHPEESDVWHAGLGEDEAAAGHSAPRPFRLAPSAGPRELAVRTPSSEEDAGPVSGAWLLRSAEQATRGTLVHGWLETLEWIEDFDADDDALLAAGRHVEPDADRRREALELLRAALAAEPVRAALSRAAVERGDDVEVEVRREHRFRTILATGGEELDPEQLWVGSIDRLVLVREGGRVTRAEVLDYKTDAIEASDVPARAERYRPQLERYAQVVAAQLGIAPSSIRERLVFLAPGRVLDL